MRILLVNHGSAGEWGGGDGVQIRETGKRLQQRGHDVVSVNSDNPDCRGFDLVHIFNCRVEGSFHQQMASCKAARVPVVVSPIWISLARALWGSRGSTGVLTQAVQQGENAAQPLLEKLRKREMVVQMQDCELNAEGQGDSCWPLNREFTCAAPSSRWLATQQLARATSLAERPAMGGRLLRNRYYGVDPSLFLDADPELFREQTGLKEPFIMQAGRIEPGKNQAMLCWALRKTDVPIVLIGGSKHWPSYAELCRSISGPKLTIIDHIPQHLLASAYAAAAVHTLPSWMETCGLVSLEAALSGTPLVGSTFGHELEYLEGDAWYGDPGDPASIRNAVLSALHAGRKHPRPIAMKQKVLGRFNWEKTVSATERLYQRVLEQRSQGTST